MISRNLFFKLQKEDMKRRLWVAALSMLVFFLFGPVLLALVLEGMVTDVQMQYTLSQITSTIGPGFELQYVISITAALICASSGFFYLHSRKKVDFYHSAPVRRELLFIVNYINGILLYFIPYLISMLLNFAVLLAGNNFNSKTMITGLEGLGMNLLYFLLLYTLTVLAVILTGNGVISLLLSGIFFSYGPLVMIIKNMYCRDFFRTYFTLGHNEDLLLFLSPIGKYVSRSVQIKGGDYQGIGLSVLVTVAVTFLIAALAVLLYKKRPSEAAGKAIAFQYAKPIIKFMLVIPISLGGGLIFREAANQHSDIWMIFGLILIFVIASAIIEIIHQFDLKKAFDHKRGLAVTGTVAAVIVCVFRFDLISYDTYIPDKDKVASMSISVPGLDGSKNYLEINKTGADYIYYQTFQYEQKHMRLKNIDAAYEIAKRGIEEAKKPVADAKGEYGSMVAFHLKNGRTIVRNYTMVSDTDLSLLNQVYSDSDYKEGYYPIYSWKTEYISSVTVSNGLEEKSLTLSKQEMEELLAIYKEELKGLNLDEIKKSRPVASIQFGLISRNEFSYDVFPGFTKTREFLAAHGLSTENSLSIEDVNKIIITNQLDYNSDTVYKKAQYIKSDSSSLDNNQFEYTDKDQIAEILQTALPESYCVEFGVVFAPNNDLMLNVIFDTDNYGNERSDIYYFSKDNIPDFVIKDLNYNSK